MKKQEKIRIFGASDCYGLTKELSFTLRHTYVMKDEVDKEFLEEAVHMLEKRFSYLKLSLKKNLHEFYYVENPEPWVIIESDKAIPLNGKESNNHLLAFSYYRNLIYINAYHGQLDGTGLYRLGKALIYYYCCLKYKKALGVPDVPLIDDLILPEESMDAYQAFYNEHKGDKSKSFSPQKTIKRPMKLHKMGLVKKGNRTSFKLSLFQSDLMKYCSSFDGSPVTAIALMMAEAVRRVHPDSEKEIVAGIPVNLRDAMGFSVSHSNTYSKVYIHYSKKLQEKDFETQGTICRGIVIRNTDHDLLRNEAIKYCKKLAMLNMIPLTFIKQLAARVVADQMKSAETLDVTYVGKCEYGEMAQFISSMYTDVDAYGLGLQTIISAFGDRFFLSIDEDWAEKVYIDSFLDVLKERGVRYTVDYDGPNETALMRNV